MRSLFLLLPIVFLTASTVEARVVTATATGHITTETPDCNTPGCPMGPPSGIGIGTSFIFKFSYDSSGPNGYQTVPPALLTLQAGSYFASQTQQIPVRVYDYGYNPPLLGYGSFFCVGNNWGLCLLAPAGVFSSLPQNLPPLSAYTSTQLFNVIAYGATGYLTGFSGVVDTLVSTSCDVSASPCITSPSDGAKPQSQFVALSGIGTARHSISVQVDSVSLGSVVVDSEGNWEALAYISQLAFGATPIIQVQDQATSSLSNTITVHITQNSVPPGPVSTAAFLPLRSGDIFVDGDPSSAQEPLYGPNYTHTALYLGGDADGNPRLAEAVTPSEAGIWGQVRALPLDQSLVWNALAVPGSRIAAFTPQVPLSGATRSAIVAWANNITKQGLPYWNTSTDFVSPILVAYSTYVATLGVITPRFTSVLNLLNANKNSTSKFICSTLVWRAYYEGTGHTLDISSPNLMSAAPGSDLGNLPSLLRDSLIAKLAPVLVVPETFVRNTQKLRQIF